MNNLECIIKSFKIDYCAFLIIEFTLARSSSGLGHRPLKAGITGSPEGIPMEESRTQ